MRVLVTGASGFIGATVCDLLLQEGFQVQGVDTLNDAYDVRLKQWRLNRLLAQCGFEFQRGDVCDKASMATIFQGADIPFGGVIHLAARAGVRQSVEDPWIYFGTNVIGTLNLLELCRKHSVPKFVLASSSSVYGIAPDGKPARETDSTDQPLSPYAASKKAAEVLSHSYHHLYGFDIAVFRYFTVYGPAGRPDMALFRFVQRISENRILTIFGDGSQSRDFTHVRDVARGTIGGLGLQGFHVINLGSDRPIVLLDAISLMESAIGKRAKLRFREIHTADVPVTWADISRAKVLMGWGPHEEFGQGIREMVDWYQENQSWAREISTD